MFLQFSSITTGANKETGNTCLSFRITLVSWDSCFAITFVCCTLQVVFSSWPLYYMSFDIRLFLLLWYCQSFLAIHQALAIESIHWCSLWTWGSYLFWNIVLYWKAFMPVFLHKLVDYKNSNDNVIYYFILHLCSTNKQNAFPL